MLILYYYFPLWLVSFVCLRKSFPTSGSWRQSSMSPSKIFVLFTFPMKSIIPLRLVSAFTALRKSGFILPYAYPIYLTFFIEKTIFTLCITVRFCHKSGGNICGGLFLDSTFYLVILAPITYSLNCFTFISLDIQIFLLRVIFFKIVLAVLESLHFHVNLMISLSIFTYKMLLSLQLEVH